MLGLIWLVYAGPDPLALITDPVGLIAPLDLTLIPLIPGPGPDLGPVPSPGPSLGPGHGPDPGKGLVPEPGLGPGLEPLLMVCIPLPGLLMPLGIFLPVFSIDSPDGKFIPEMLLVSVVDILDTEAMRSGLGF